MEFTEDSIGWLTEAGGGGQDGVTVAPIPGRPLAIIPSMLLANQTLRSLKLHLIHFLFLGYLSLLILLI